MESWRLVWRNGFAPHLPTTGLELLERALDNDESRLVQGATTTPPPLMCVQDWPVESCDAISMCGIQDAGSWGRAKVGQVEEFFAKACFDADQKLGEPAACRHFLNWYDDEPRESMRIQLLHEVRRELDNRVEMVNGPPDEFKAAFMKTPHEPTLSGAIADWYDDRGEQLPAKRWRDRMARLQAGDFA